MLCKTAIFNLKKVNVKSLRNKKIYGDKKIKRFLDKKILR